MFGAIRRTLYAVGAALMALALAFHLGQRRARARQRAAEDAAYRKTRERIDHAPVSSGDAADDAAWLRERAARSGL